MMTHVMISQETIDMFRRAEEAEREDLRREREAAELLDRVANSIRVAFTEAELSNPRIAFEELTDILARAAIEAMPQP